MAFTLDNIVPWGRSFDEYAAMFALSEADLKKNILSCGDGPAGFNAELTKRGGTVVSVDPLYAFSADEIRTRINETYDVIMEETKRNRDEFVWEKIKSVEELGSVRMAAMEEFLVDYETGKTEGRYLAERLPALPFGNNQFGLALSSHFLFLYSEQLSLDFHLDSIREMCRVAGEARIFPLLELGAKESRHLKEVFRLLTAEGYRVDIEQVPYEFQRGADRMMRVSRP